MSNRLGDTGDTSIGDCRRGMHVPDANGIMCMYCCLLLNPGEGVDPNQYRQNK